MCCEEWASTVLGRVLPHGMNDAALLDVMRWTRGYECDPGNHGRHTRMRKQYHACECPAPLLRLQAHNMSMDAGQQSGRTAQCCTLSGHASAKSQNGTTGRMWCSGWCRLWPVQQAHLAVGVGAGSALGAAALPPELADDLLGAAGPAQACGVPSLLLL